MKKIAVTQLFNENEEIYFNEYSTGEITKVIGENEAASNLEEVQEMINTGRYHVTEINF